MSARQEGYNAYKAGVPLAENPYDEDQHGSVYSDYNQWEEGWFDAQAEEAHASQQNKKSS